MLLSTDAEISELYSQKLSQWIGRSYILQYNDITSSTEIVKGYFEFEEAA